MTPTTRARWCPPLSRVWLRMVSGEWQKRTIGFKADLETVETGAIGRLLSRYPDRPRWLLVDDSIVIRATLRLPLAAIDHLRQAVRYEIDRQTPYAESDVAYDARVVERDSINKRMTVELLVIPRIRLAPLVEEAERELGVALHGVDVAGSDGHPLGVNLLEVEARAPLHRPYRLLNSILAAFAVVVVGLALWRTVINERSRADALEASLKQQAYQAKVVSIQRQRLEDLVAGAKKVTIERKRRTDLVTLSNALAERLPDNIHIERMNLQNGQMELSGQGAQAAALMSYLGANPLWDAPSLVGAAMNATPFGRDRFGIGLHLKSEPHP
ncbi:PilN domain-containing protein [Solilutibacter silvestris]|uniref:PilN domain-containing protein n=1 Tax=Solilutibacter silvestris TaxID=1645665 RepID=UPI00101AE3CC|nr:PilN domain-containing protein [Lysobacter silvestris]